MALNDKETILKNMSRLCHVIKRDDFDGYGFNLHAERGKPGQYIGKVDEGSPASFAGLCEGDRIIEVNSTNIGNETHKQVVQRIKTIANEVKLLVVDPCVEVSQDNQIVHKEQITNENNNIDKTIIITSDIIENHKNDSKVKETTEKIEKTLTDELLIKSELSVNQIQSSPNNSLLSDNLVEKTNEDNDAKYQQEHQITNSKSVENGKSIKETNGNLITTTIIPTPPTVEPPALTNKNDIHNNKVQTNDNNNKKDMLNLKITAAEMRAKLAAKKKYDPKSDSVDLRQKYEIIQKL